LGEEEAEEEQARSLLEREWTGFQGSLKETT
jgi:hypothetical protein